MAIYRIIFEQYIDVKSDSEEEALEWFQDIDLTDAESTQYLDIKFRRLVDSFKHSQ